MQKNCTALYAQKCTELYAHNYTALYTHTCTALYTHNCTALYTHNYTSLSLTEVPWTCLPCRALSNLISSIYSNKIGSEPGEGMFLNLLSEYFSFLEEPKEIDHRLLNIEAEHIITYFSMQAKSYSPLHGLSSSFRASAFGPGIIFPFGKKAFFHWFDF